MIPNLSGRENSTKRLLLVGALCLPFALPVFGQKASLKQSAPFRLPAQFAWTTEAWTADEKPYQAERIAIAIAQRQGKNMLALAKQYGAAAKAKPKSDALAVFRWGYAAWLAYDYGNGNNTPAAYELFDANKALETTPSPHSYQYDRLRFLIEACANSQRGVKGLGERLLKRNLNDFDVVFYQIGMTYGSLSEADNQRALELSKMLIQKYPNNSTGYERAGTTYQGLWWGHHKKPDAQTAIDYFRKGKALLPANDPNQAKYDYQIHSLEREMLQAH